MISSVSQELSAARPRFLHLDIARGLGILMVAWYHSGYSAGSLFNLFVVPLFFVMSGVFFHPERPMVEFLKSKWRGLIAPFLLAAVISFLLEWLCYDFVHTYSGMPPGAETFSFSAIGNTSIWFLLALLWCTLIAFSVERIRGTVWKILIYALLGLAGWASAVYRLHLPFFVGQALLMIPFFALGYYGRSWWLRSGRASWWLLTGCVLILLAETAYSLVVQGAPITNVHKMTWDTLYVFSFAGAVAGVVLTVNGARLLCGTLLGEWIAVVGAESLTVVCFHCLLLNIPFVAYLCTDFAASLSNPAVQSLLTLVVGLAVTAGAILLGRLLRAVLPMFFPVRAKVPKGVPASSVD